MVILISEKVVKVWAVELTFAKVIETYIYCVC